MGSVEDCVELGGAGGEGEGCVSVWNISKAVKEKHKTHKRVGHQGNSLQLLVQIPRALMEPDHTRDSHAGALEVRDAAGDPVRPHTDGGEGVHAGFGAQVVDLGGRGVEFEEGVVDCAGDGLGEGVGGSFDVFEGGDGRGDDGGPFGVGVAGCWGHGCCLVVLVSFSFFWLESSGVVLGL